MPLPSDIGVRTSETADRRARDQASQGGVVQGITEKQPALCWAVRGFRIYLPVAGIQETGGNRIVERERPYRDGAKLDDTGSKARRWRIRVLFENSIADGESGLNNGGLLLYPDVLRMMLGSFAVHETGELTIPAEGKVKARAESWDRNEDPADARDAALVTFTFVEDNEDRVGVDAFKAPAAAANARRLAESATFDHESVGNGHNVIAQLQEYVSDLEGLVNSPSEFRQDLEWKSRRIQELAKQAVGIFSKAGQRGRDTLLGPRGSRAEAKMVREQDMAGRASAQSLQNRPQVGRYITRVDTSIFDISAAIRQPVDELLQINPQLEDPFFIIAGSEVRVFVGSGAVL